MQKACPFRKCKQIDRANMRVLHQGKRGEQTWTCKYVETAWENEKGARWMVNRHGKAEAKRFFDCCLLHTDEMMIWLMPAGMCMESAHNAHITGGVQPRNGWNAVSFEVQMRAVLNKAPVAIWVMRYEWFSSAWNTGQKTIWWEPWMA